MVNHLPTLATLRQSWSAVATQFPLIAAILAPSSVLFDIPALSQHWLDGPGGQTVPDPVWNTVLSAVGLAFNVLANALLVVRFSNTSRRVAVHATRLSTVCWIIKTGLELGNLAAFDLFFQPEIRDYQEGFWCAIVSLIISGTIAFTLGYHWTTRRGHVDSTEDKLEARHFMLSFLSFVSLLALEALIFSRIEGWSFFDGIYFAVVAAFTIGFGDFTPTQTASRVLLFPFLIASIALLANQISMIIGYFTAKAEARKDAWRAEYEAQQQRVEDAAHPQADLAREMTFLQRTRWREDMISNAYDLLYSLLGMVTFWFIGAALFHFMEGWDYGLSLYFCYIVFLTIGFGDFSPKTPAGRVVFVVYAFLAVPVVTSFAVQTITNVVSSVTQARFDKQREKLGLDNRMPPDAEAEPRSADPANPIFVAHAEWVERQHELFDDRVAPGKALEDLTESEARAADAALLDELLSATLRLEAQARAIMVGQLPVAGRASLLLKADRNVQQRDLAALERAGVRAGGDEEGAHAGFPGRVDDSFEELEVLQQVHLYRKTFAAILAAGSKLKRLQGVEQHQFERRKMNHESKEESGVETSPRRQESDVTRRSNGRRSSETRT